MISNHSFLLVANYCECFLCVFDRIFFTFPSFFKEWILFSVALERKTIFQILFILFFVEFSWVPLRFFQELSGLSGRLWSPIGSGKRHRIREQEREVRNTGGKNEEKKSRKRRTLFRRKFRKYFLEEMKYAVGSADLHLVFFKYLKWKDRLKEIIFSLGVKKNIFQTTSGFFLLFFFVSCFSPFLGQILFCLVCIAIFYPFAAGGLVQKKLWLFLLMLGVAMLFGFGFVSPSFTASMEVIEFSDRTMGSGCK